MIVRVITIHVKPEMVQAFEDATERNHLGSVNEEGVLRFDVLRDSDDPTTYYLYEVYRDESATAAHKETHHYARWKAEVEEMMAAPRTSIRSESLLPSDPAAW